MKENLTERGLVLLRGIYKKWAICLVEIVEYSDQEPRLIKARMRAPHNYSYTKKKTDHITGVQYYLALSQLVYVFIDFLINDGKVELLTEAEMEKLMSDKSIPWYFRWRLRMKKSHFTKQEYLFEELMRQYKLVFLRNNISFKKRLKNTDIFEIEMKIKSARRAGSGVPLICIQVGGDTLEGEIMNAAILAEKPPPQPS